MTLNTEDTTHISNSIKQQIIDSTNYTYLIYILAQHNLHIFQVTRFGPLARPSSDLYIVKNFVKKPYKTLYVCMTKISHSHYKYVIKHTLKYYVKLE